MNNWKSLFIFSAIIFCFFYAFGEINITINVTPNVINIQSKSSVITVHTNIDYDVIVGSSVKLNGIEINSWKADDRGNFVAKFLSDEVKSLDNLVIGGLNEIILTGITVDEKQFIGRQEIKIISIVPTGGKTK